MDYDAFGVVVADSDPGFQPFGFAGGLYDPDTIGSSPSAVRVNGLQTAHYDYDANGNRLARITPTTTETATYDDQDRLLSYGDLAYTYDAFGQSGLTRKSNSSTNEDTYLSYDELGNLRFAVVSNLFLDYTIDPQNRRIGRSNDVTRFGLLYKDQLEPVAMLDANNAVIAHFVYATRRHVPDFMVRGETLYRIVSDHLGSVRLVVNVSDGSIAQRIDYDEWGVPTLVSGTWDVQPFGFAGGLYDADTGLTRFGARDYDAHTGRWTAKDPILFRGGTTNLYEYVNGDPVNKVDVTGKCPWCFVAGACAAAAYALYQLYDFADSYLDAGEARDQANVCQQNALENVDSPEGPQECTQEELEFIRKAMESAMEGDDVSEPTIVPDPRTSWDW